MLSLVISELTSTLGNTSPELNVVVKNTASVKINVALDYVKKNILHPANAQFKQNLLDLGVIKITISHRSYDKDKKKPAWSIRGNHLQIVLNAQTPTNAEIEYIRLCQANVIKKQLDCLTGDSRLPLSELKGQNISEKLKSVPGAGKLLYQTFWEALDQFLQFQGNNKDIIELCSGTGGQFDLYPKGVDLKNRIVGLDCHAQSNLMLLEKYGVPAFCGDVFDGKTYRDFQQTYGSRSFGGCIGTNAIYFARNNIDLRTLFFGIDNVLFGKDLGSRFIAQLISGRPPSLSDWGGNPYKFREKFFIACENELKQLGYSVSVKPLLISLPVNQFSDDQRRYLDMGKRSSGHDFNAILWDGVGCNFTPEGVLTDFLDYEYQVQKVLPLDKLYERASAWLLLATKVKLPT